MRPSLKVSSVIFFQMPQLGKQGPQSQSKLQGSLRTQARPLIHFAGSRSLSFSLKQVKGDSKVNFDQIVTGPQERLHIKFPKPEHVVGLANFPTIDLNSDQRVQAFAAEQHAIILQHFFRHVEGSLVNPVAFAHPLHRFFVVAIKRIGDFFGRQQVRMHTTRAQWRESSYPFPLAIPSIHRPSSDDEASKPLRRCKGKPTAPKISTDAVAVIVAITNFLLLIM